MIEPKKLTEEQRKQVFQEIANLKKQLATNPTDGASKTQLRQLAAAVGIDIEKFIQEVEDRAKNEERSYAQNQQYAPEAREIENRLGEVKDIEETLKDRLQFLNSPNSEISKSSSLMNKLLKQHPPEEKLLDEYINRFKDEEGIRKATIGSLEDLHQCNQELNKLKKLDSDIEELNKKSGTKLYEKKHKNLKEIIGVHQKGFDDAKDKLVDHMALEGIYKQAKTVTDPEKNPQEFKEYLVEQFRSENIEKKKSEVQKFVNETLQSPHVDIKAKVESFEKQCLDKVPEKNQIKDDKHPINDKVKEEAKKIGQDINRNSHPPQNVPKVGEEPDKKTPEKPEQKKQEQVQSFAQRIKNRQQNNNGPVVGV